MKIEDLWVRKSATSNAYMQGALMGVLLGIAVGILLQEKYKIAKSNKE